MRFSIRTSDYSLYGALKNANIDGVSINIGVTDSTPTIPPDNLQFVVTAVGPVAIQILAKWLYVKFKDQPDEKIVINGNQIHIDSIDVTKITHLIKGEKESGQSSRETD